MKLPQNPKSVLLILFILVSFVPQVVQHFDSLYFSLPYLNAAAVVVYSRTGYCLVESALKKRKHEPGSVWYKSWPTELIVGISILIRWPILLGMLLAKVAPGIGVPFGRSH
jgi:hypothetical protein